MPGTHSASRNSRRITLAGLTAVTVGTVLMMAWAVFSTAALADPPGNNGTIKVDGVEFDSHPDNEPHVGCTFQIDWYGFDKGDLFSDVTFETQAPTLPQNSVLLTDTVFVGEDDNSGGGSEAGLDASETYTLDFTGFEPHDIQGFHVKLTVHTDGSIGADTKHKVFWVTECIPPTTTSTTTTSTKTTTTGTTTTSTGTTSTSTKTTTTGTTSTGTTSTSTGTTSTGTTSTGTTSTTSPTVGPTTVEPSESETETETETVSPTSVTPGGLAFTGVENVVPLGAVALILMTGGSGLLWAGARRRREDQEDE